MTFKFDAPEVAGVSARVMTPAATNVRAHAYLRVLNRLAERYTRSPHISRLIRAGAIWA